MNNKNGKRYSRIAKLIGILSGFVLVLGTSYAVFRVTTTGEKENVVSAGKLDVRIENEQNEINLGNTLPQSEEEGKQNTPYTFDVVNRGNINAMYDLYLEVNNDSTLDASVIRYYLTVVEDGEEKQITPVGSIITSEEESTKEGKKAYKIDTKYLDVNKTNNYKLYLWIDYDATKEEAANKVFKANIRVDAEQIYKGNKLIKQVDVSENNDGSVTAYMYGNDTVVIKGKGQIKSDLSDSLKFVSDEVLPNYKKVLQSMGVDASNINTLDELQTYLDSQDSNFNNQLNNQITYICAKETLKDMNKDSDKVIDDESLIAYLQELGWMDEEGNQTEAGEEFFTKFENKYNTNYSFEGYSPSKIVLEEGITNVPSDLFQGNENITEVKIPNSVQTIDDNAFAYCTNLKIVNIPDGVTSIGNYSFNNCHSLESIDIPGSVRYIGDNSFFGSVKLSNVYLHDGLEQIGQGSFGNTSIKKIVIPDTVTNIGWSAFSDCKSLSRVKLSNNITVIEDSLFSKCVNLTSIVLPEGITEIKQRAFEKCSSLASVNLPNGIKSIGTYAFSSCNLTSVVLPENLEKIFSSFSNCLSLKHVTISENNPNYFTYDDVLYSKSNSVSEIEMIPAGKTHITFSNKISKLDFPSSLPNLTSINIPASVNSIRYPTSYNLSSLVNIEIDKNNPKYLAEDGVIYNKTKTKIEFIAQGKENITIPSSVTEIFSYELGASSKLKEINVDNQNSVYSSVDGVLYNKDKTSLLKVPNEKTSITIPSSVLNIGKYAFAYSKITAVSLPNTLETIEAYAFSDCYTLASITIPNSVTSVGGYAFDNWDSQTINIDNTREYVNSHWASNWFYYMSNTKVNYLRS